MKKKKTPRLPKINWKPIEPCKGCARFQSGDGMFMLVYQDRYEDILLSMLYVLWQWKKGSWWKVDEHRSRNRIEKSARIRNAELDREDTAGF